MSNSFRMGRNIAADYADYADLICVIRVIRG